MPLQRYYCMSCRESIYNKTLNGVRIPLIFYFVLGQPDDTGPALDVMAKDVAVPSFVREFFHPDLPNQPVELCIPCVALLFGLKVYTPDKDPMHSPEQMRDTSNELKALKANTTDPAVDRRHAIFGRVLTGIKVGRLAMKPPKLPKVDKALRARLANAEQMRDLHATPPVPVDAAVARAIPPGVTLTPTAGITAARKQPRKGTKGRKRAAAKAGEVKHVTGGAAGGT